MANLSLSVRTAAGSLLVLSVLHILIWAVMAVAAYSVAPATYPTNLLFPVACCFSVAGTFGVVVGVELFRARPWARVAALVIAALVLLFCGLGILILAMILFGLFGIGLGIEVPTANRTYLSGMGVVYLLIFLLAVWWIYVFSRNSVARQFSAASATATQATSRRPSCPPPIALLGWLMIVSSGLSALSWPLILGKIPAMLFIHVFSAATSKWIWAANIVLFIVCGIGLLKLQRWSYTGAIALHVFWLASIFVSQLSPLYEPYLNNCINLLELPQTYPGLSLPHFSPWVTAITSAIPTALLVSGLFYYRRNFLKAVDDSRQSSS